MADVNYVGKGWYEVRFSSDGDELTFKRMSPPDTPPNVSELDFAKIKQREAELLNEIKTLELKLDAEQEDKNFWMREAMSRGGR